MNDTQQATDPTDALAQHAFSDTELAHRCEQLAEVLQGPQCGFVAIDSSHRLSYVSKSIASWVGHTSEEMLGMCWEDFVPPELAERIPAERHRITGGDMRLRLTILQRRDSTTFPVLLAPNPMLGGEADPRPGISILIDLGAILTAKPFGYVDENDLRGRLNAIAVELQSLALASELSPARDVPLEHLELSSLSGREREVLVCLMAGERVPAIAERLGISQHTVRNHCKSMFRKIGVRNQSELISRVREIAGQSDAALPRHQAQ